MATGTRHGCRSVICGILLCVFASPTSASTRIAFAPGSDVSATVNESDKARIALLVDSSTQRKRLLMAYQDGADDAADILVRTSSDDGRNWDLPVNLSVVSGHTTVLGTRATARWPAIVQSRGAVLVLWMSTYCPGGVQGSHTNTGLPTPFYCIWIARSLDAARTWSTPQQLSDGSRDAINPVGFATDAGAAIAWQEDPLGLQPGEAEGPGDGGSGAHTSPGTDIYYTALSTSLLVKGQAFPASVQVSDNDSEAHGAPAASRPQIRVVGSTAMLAYEETKGGGGKDVIWHTFPLSAPHSSAAGAILNDGSENSRRVRFVAQGLAQSGPTQTTVLVFWRQGVGGQGAPADIVLRRATNGYGALDFGPAINMSAAGLDDSTSLNAAENARAHRAILRGDFAAFVYTHTPDDAEALAQRANYNVYIRLSQDGGQTWDAARNLSQIADTRVTAAEPRLEGTPATIASGFAEDVQNTNAIFVAWGEESNDADAIRGDVFIRASRDRGATFEDRAPLAGGPGQQFEAQFRATPDGGVIHAVWMDDSTGARKATFATSLPSLVIHRTGDGSGRVLAEGIDCGIDCEAAAPLGTAISLTVVAASGSAFSGWLGDPDCIDGTVAMTTLRDCIATFAKRNTSMDRTDRADFDGDAMTDVAMYVPATGELSIYMGDADGGAVALQHLWSPGWTVRRANLNDDAFTDLFLYNSLDGRWVQAINNRLGDFFYVSGVWSAGWDVHVLSLGGDALSDVFLYRPTDGVWFKCFNTGNGDFRYASGRWSPGWGIYPVRLDDDELADLVLYNEATGVAFLAMNDGGGGWSYRSEAWSPGWRVIPGNFTDARRSDLLLYSELTGRWAIGTNRGGWFEYISGAWSPGWTIRTGDMSGDDRADLFLYNENSGNWVVGTAVDGRWFSFTGGAWSPGWKVDVLELNEDAKADVLLYDRGSGRWFKALTIEAGRFAYLSGTWSTEAEVVGHGEH